ncbi:hypothetical protein TNCV_2342171 [Trichonephila clavipes]|nr:hypothetical protein TNCV_2342171 [Trichonephila clavipes]
MATGSYMTPIYSRSQSQGGLAHPPSVDPIVTISFHRLISFATSSNHRVGCHSLRVIPSIFEKIFGRKSIGISIQMTQPPNAWWLYSFYNVSHDIFAIFPVKFMTKEFSTHCSLE